MPTCSSRPTRSSITITEGTNTLVGVDPEKIVAEAKAALSGRGKAGRTPELWDGKASDRIARVFSTWWDARRARAR